MRLGTRTGSAFGTGCSGGEREGYEAVARFENWRPWWTSFQSILSVCSACQLPEVSIYSYPTSQLTRHYPIIINLSNTSASWVAWLGVWRKLTIVRNYFPIEIQFFEYLLNPYFQIIILPFMKLWNYVWRLQQIVCRKYDISDSGQCGVFYTKKQIQVFRQSLSMKWMESLLATKRDDICTSYTRASLKFRSVASLASWASSERSAGPCPNRCKPCFSSVQTQVCIFRLLFCSGLRITVTRQVLRIQFEVDGRYRDTEGRRRRSICVKFVWWFFFHLRFFLL